MQQGWFAASSDLRALAISTAATPARGDCSTSGTMVRAVSSDSLRGGCGAARTQYCRYRQAQDNSFVQLHELDLICAFEDICSALRRRGAFSLLPQRLDAREHFIRRSARIGALRLRNRKLGVKVRLRSRALRLLPLSFGQRALCGIQLVASPAAARRYPARIFRSSAAPAGPKFRFAQLALSRDPTRCCKALSEPRRMLTPSANDTAVLTGRVVRYFVRYFIFDPRGEGVSEQGSPS